MNEFEVISRIKRENLDERNYTKSLIDEAYLRQMLTDDDMANIQLQILELLDERIYRYNGMHSTSIKKEKIEDISKSNSYTIRNIFKNV